MPTRHNGAGSGARHATAQSNRLYAVPAGAGAPAIFAMLSVRCLLPQARASHVRSQPVEWQGRYRQGRSPSSARASSLAGGDRSGGLRIGHVGLAGGTAARDCAEPAGHLAAALCPAARYRRWALARKWWRPRNTGPCSTSRLRKKSLTLGSRHNPATNILTRTGTSSKNTRCSTVTKSYCAGLSRPEFFRILLSARTGARKAARDVDNR
jgi:hypothetical protein